MLKDYIIIFFLVISIVSLTVSTSIFISLIVYRLKHKTRLTSIDKYFDNLSIEDYDDQTEDLFEREEETWLLENQHSSLSCFFCLEDSHIALCADKIGRPICPECRDLFNRVNKLFKEQQHFKYKKDWIDFIVQARNEIKTEKQHT